MLKKLLLTLSFPLLLSATTMPELFDALKNHSQTKSDEMLVKMAEISQSKAYSQLYPTIKLQAAYDNYNTPTGMLPVAPNTLLDMVKDQSVAQPFSYNIYRAGANFSMPIFVKSIFTSADKAQAMRTSAQAKKHINLLKNEAIIVGSNANLLYLEALEKSLELKKKSLLETQRTIQIKVNNGRSAASALYKIEDALNQISITQNNILLQKNSIKSSIEALTGIQLSEGVPMQESMTYTQTELASLKPLEEKIRANRLGVKAEKEKLYPTLVAHGSYTFSSGSAYNNNKDINEEYGDIGLLLTIPLLEVSQYDEIKKTKLQLKSDEVDLQKQRDELSAKATMLQNALPLYKNSILLSDKSVQNKLQLLKIAKANYENGRLSTEEYLRYEDDVVDAKAKLYEAQAKKWQTLMELAVIYANDIEEMVQ